MFGVQINIFRSFFPWICVRCSVEIVSLILLQRLPYALPYQHFNPLNAKLNSICYLLALLELTIFSTLAG